MSITLGMSPLARPPNSHPRRSLADNSVSLLHRPTKRVKRDGDSHSTGHTVHTSSRGDGASPSSLQPLMGRDGSAESSNVDHWFDTANNGVQENSTAMIDNDPPFFLRNASSSDTPQNGQKQVPNTVPNLYDLDLLRSPRTHLRMHMDNSSIDDFRSVIDDLTVENKKLKRRLKKYENMYAPHLDNDRLFEVRVHGLPPEKKHELEDTLRKFTAGLTDLKHDVFPSNGYEGLAPIALKNDMTNDSAYASASASGQGSSSKSDVKQNRSMKTVASRQQNIQSYLHDIPEGLMPNREPAAMSDGVRKRVVVRRLEQLFAGKGAMGDGPQQSMQQQEVSQSAARADRSQLEAAGQFARQEGNRESLIMDKDIEQNVDSSVQPSSNAALTAKSTASQPGTTQQQDFAAQPSIPTTLEQRPTRPLDLDPYRAQVPTDNIRYMRHLGFSPLDPELQPADEDHGWVYLNFLINMAQLHTINVTTEFVRQAVEAHSERLEVSPDGRKLRWKGYNGLTQLSKGTEDSHPDSPSGHVDVSFSQRPKLTHSSSRSTVPTIPGGGNRTRYEPSKYAYLSSSFRRGRLDSQADSSSGADDDSAFCQDAGMRSSSGKRPAKNDGPIIFYNNARFCTDLSGTRGSAGAQSIPAYMTMGTEPLGKPRDLSDYSLETRGPLHDSQYVMDRMDVDDKSASMSSSHDIDFLTPLPATLPTSNPASLLDMEVTGMGGIWPSDNFSIDVKNQYTLDSSQYRPEQGNTAGSLPPRIARALGRTHENRAKGLSAPAQILSIHRHELLPSKLPPTIEYMAFGSSSLEDEDMDDENVTDIDQLTSVQTPSVIPGVVHTTPAMPFTESEDKDESEDEDETPDDDESEASLDLLAAARAVDPEAIRAREREYDANMAERLAEEIPAGSSAATAGGGSGFASPASGVDEDERRRARRAVRKQQAAAVLKHAMTPNGMGTGAREEMIHSGSGKGDL